MENNEGEKMPVAEIDTSTDIDPRKSKYLWLIVVLIMLAVVAAVGYLIIRQNELLTSEIESGLVTRNTSISRQALKDIGERVKEITNGEEGLEKGERLFEYIAGPIKLKFNYPERWHIATRQGILSPIAIMGVEDAKLAISLSAYPIVFPDIIEMTNAQEINLALLGDVDVEKLMVDKRDLFSDEEVVTNEAGIKVYKFTGDTEVTEYLIYSSYYLFEIPGDEKPQYIVGLTQSSAFNENYQDSVQVLDRIVETISLME